ncbi:MAG TPA: hypothetical protein DCS07_05025 [Bdellovibrionales bacterium]|nr:MAG: hypothetical protein A2Z97_16150 [Bdellovibrionales bacterium GWB1_52_6]OFZ05052.1 MAG: hypothetical protein A2X97_00470 [Bdellovibrionales bacterium GWA1_52_35]OFZ37247.1 MAG: hypothetical protein A2070_07110 [Bdellovibrionales bacterium GWC1_52_8]HAR41983.1 hypothetical protein [Bdellovibrionales bacterium]HCM41288.1 hypothetical protein [Bdellovibrionales bacterium]
MTARYRHPSEIKKKEPTKTLSVRVKESTKEALREAAENAGHDLSVLVTTILEDYVTWLREQGTKGKR